MTIKLSVVTGTLNRLPMLKQCIGSIRMCCMALPYEIIIVDGGSLDGTREYLIEQPDVRVIWQGERRGAIAAFNAGFYNASGEYILNLNDDALCRGTILEDACRQLDLRPEVGQIAIPFSDPGRAPACYQITVGTPAKNYLYANFGVTRRLLGNRLGWWGKYGYHYGGDTELSLQIWKAGKLVSALVPTETNHIQHLRTQDSARVGDTGESKALINRWQDWNGATNGNYA